MQPARAALTHQFIEMLVFGAKLLIAMYCVILRS
jgi:hypothetical protein